MACRLWHFVGVSEAAGSLAEVLSLERSQGSYLSERDSGKLQNYYYI